MRVIKFRAQQFNHGKHGFQYGSYATDNKDYHAITKESKSSPDEMYNILINPETLGQFTGLQDKNGVDIYEGDIVSDQFDCGQLVIILWDDSKACFESKNIKYDGMMKRHYHRPVSICVDTITKGAVIGNIHENPELIT